jgi:hypothetical protein
MRRNRCRFGRVTRPFGLLSSKITYIKNVSQYRLKRHHIFAGFASAKWPSPPEAALCQLWQQRLRLGDLGYFRRRREVFERWRKDGAGFGGAIGGSMELGERKRSAKPQLRVPALSRWRWLWKAASAAAGLHLSRSLAIGSLLSRPRFTAAITSAASAQRAISNGRLSIMALYSLWVSSYSGWPRPISVPRSP